MTIDRSMTSWL